MAGRKGSPRNRIKSDASFCSHYNFCVKACCVLREDSCNPKIWARAYDSHVLVSDATEWLEAEAKEDVQGGQNSCRCTRAHKTKRQVTVIGKHTEACTRSGCALTYTQAGGGRGRLLSNCSAAAGGKKKMSGKREI